jgi:hypothetical protein
MLRRVPGPTGVYVRQPLPSVVLPPSAFGMRAEQPRPELCALLD